MYKRQIVNKARGVELSYCRWGGEEFLLLGKCVDGEVPKNFLDELRVEINSKSVSYTHLDVYKRQVKENLKPCVYKLWKFFK